MKSAVSLIKRFTAVLDKDIPKLTKAPQFKIRPSMLGSACMRKVLYSAAGTPEDYPFPMSGKKRMKLGEAIHAMLHDVFSEDGILVDYHNPDGSINKDHKGKDDLEFPISSEDLFIKKGKIDAVYIIDGKLWLGEYKSINLNGFNSLNGPKGDHLIQGVTYLVLFNQLLKEGKFSHIERLKGFEKAEGVRFLYICKDDTEFKEYVVSETDKIFKMIVDKIFTVKWHYDNKVLPPKTPEYCNSCNYRDKCKKNQLF